MNRALFRSLDIMTINDLTCIDIIDTMKNKSRHKNAVIKPPMKTDTHLTNYKTEFSIAIYQDEGEWVAHNLELDLVACDQDKDKALEELRVLTLNHINFCIQNECVDQLMRPAPARFWEQRAHKVTAQVVAEIIQHKIDLKELVKNARIFEIENPPDIAEERQTS